MKAVIAYALAGALIAYVLVGAPGCASDHVVQDAVAQGTTLGRDALNKALYYAQDAVAVRGAVCAVDPHGKPCDELTKLLDAFFDYAVKVEDAINKGEASAAEVEQLEDLIRSILFRAQTLLKGQA